MLRKVLLPVVLVALAVTGLVFATAGIEPSIDHFDLEWIESIEKWQGSTTQTDVENTEQNVVYFLKASPANLTGGPLSEVRMADDDEWTDGFDDYLTFGGNGGTVEITITAKCDDPEGDEAEGWAKIELFVDTDSSQTLNSGDQLISASHIHGVHPYP
jgi:hypothetical protein